MPPPSDRNSLPEPPKAPVPESSAQPADTEVIVQQLQAAASQGGNGDIDLQALLQQAMQSRAAIQGAPTVAEFSRSAALLTVTGTVYHQTIDGQTLAVETHWSRPLKTDEQPYQRRLLRIGEDWQRLDPGWLEGGASVLILHNEEGRYNTIPTTEERAKAEARIIEVGAVTSDGREVIPCWRIPPGQDLRGEPVSMDHLRLRCLRGTARATKTLIPE